MNTYLKKWLSFFAAMALLLTCTVSGLVLPVAAENLIVNGDLEADASQGWGGSAYVMDGVGVDGSRGIKIETTVNEGDSAVWPGPYYKGEFNAILEPNTTYVFSFDYKHEGKGFAKFDVTRAGTDWTGWEDVNLPNVEDWTTYTIEFTTGAAENMNANTKWEWAPAQLHYANASNYGTGAAYYDNFSLVKKSDLPAGPENIPNQWMPNANFDAAETGWKDASKNAVPVQTDATGNKYISLSADGTVLTSPNAEGTINAGDWVKVTFRARKNAAGKARLQMNWQGGMFAGYAAPYWAISTSATATYGDGEWFTYTVYGQAKTATTKVYLQFLMVAANSTVGMDIDDVTVVNLGAVDASTLNLMPAGTMDEKSQGINGPTYDGLFHDGGELVAEGDNSVLKMTANGQAYLYPAVQLSPEKANNKYKANTLYKLSYRQKGTGTTKVAIVSGRGTIQSTTGEPTTASAEWKDVTVYFRTSDSLNANYTVDFRTYGEVYLDDMTLYEVAEATAITLNKTTTELEIGGSETLTATVVPAGAYIGALTWSSDNESVATVDQTGKITAVAAGTANITVTDGTLSATCAVTVKAAALPDTTPDQWMPNSSFDAAATGWKDASKNAVPVQTDATGNKYISLSADETVLTSPNAEGTINAGDWVKVTFRARKNAPGKARLSMYWQGGMFTGYAAPHWSISTNAANAYGDGEWFTYTIYGQAKTAATKVYLQFLMVAAHSTVGMDIDDVTVQNLGAVDESTLNMLPGGSMDEKSQNLNGTSYEGLFHDGGELVAEGDNSVLKMTANGQVYLYPAMRIDPEKKSVTFKAERVYKLTYRQKGTGTTNPVIDGTRGVLLSISGDPKVASAEWKTVTVYFRTTTSINPNYTIDFKTTGEVYLDDLTLYELPSATSLTLDKTTLEMEIGDSETLAATIAPTGAYDVLTWSSNAESVATVDQNGKVTAIGSGNAVITVTDGTLSATCVVTVGTPAPATDIELNKTELSLKAGLSETLTATTTPIGAPAEAIVWSVADATIATVDQNGKVTAVKEGTTTVTATSGTLTATCTVTVVAKAKELAIPQGNVSVVPNGTITLSVKEAPVGSDIGTLTWTSSDTSVVTVDQTGKVTAVATTGSATVKVTNGEIETSVTVTVSEYANLIPNGDLELGAAETFHHLPSEGVSIEDGVGIDGGKALKLSKDRLNAVTYFKNLGHLKNYLEPNSRYVLSMKVKGAPMMLSYSTLTDVVSEDGKKQWFTNASDDWTELKVVLDTGENPDFNSNWSFFMKHNTAVDADTYIDDITLTKQPQATGLVLSPSNVELLPDEGTTLKVTSVPANAAMGKLTFTSSDPSIVSVDENGVVTAIADSGTVTITVTNHRSISATATVTVNEYGNMIKNGDFESGTLNWTPPHGNIQEGVGKDGSWGHVIYSPTAGKVESTFYKGALPLLPATTYEISLDYLATKDCKFRLWTGTIGIKSFSVDGKKADGTMWEHKSVIFTTPTDMVLNPGWDLSIAVDAEGETPAVIDNVCLRLYNSGVEAESVKMNLETATIIPGRTVNLAVAATPVNGDVNRTTWKSSDENVATVEYGVVTGVGKGTATITATTRNGLTATCVVTVSGSETYVTGGTFDGDNSEWTMTDVTLTEAIGVQDSKAASLTSGSVLSQTFMGLKPNTQYELVYRYRSAGGKATVTLKNGETTLLTNTSGNEQRWVKRVVEFTTGAEVAEETVLTFEANGAVHIDNVLLAEKASLVDFIVDSVIWDNDRQVKPGTKLIFAATIINQGADAIPVGQTFTVEICKNGEAVQTITYTTDSPMNTGDAVIVMSAAPWVAEVGDHVISARVNNDLLVPELDTTNNTKQECLRVSDEILTAPDIAQQAGFDELTFSDEFDSIDTIDTMATSKDGYKWYVTRQWGATTVTRDAYDVKDGILTLHDPVPTYGITLTTVDVNTHVGYTWNKGYLEVRACIPTPRNEYGGGPTVWSFPVTKLYETPGENDHWIEMDWLEFWGVYEGREDGYWTISIHETVRDTSTHDTINSYTNSNATVPAMGDKQWHTLGWLWDENIIQGYIDGQIIFQQTYSEDGLPMPLPRVNEGVLEEGAFSFLNEQIMCLFLSGSTEVPFMIDYVRIWQGEGGGTVLPDGGDEPEIEEIDIPVETFWNNYCTDDWGDPIVTVNEENYSYILEGGRYWNALTEERRAEINAYLAENGQPTFEELLAAAKRLEAGEDPYPEDSQPTPDTGEHTALPSAMVALMVGAVALSATRKKRKEK